MRHYRCGTKRPKRQPEGLPDGFVLTLPDEGMPRAGDRIGGFRLEWFGQVYEVEFLQPGVVDGRNPRSDWIALATGEVMSRRAAMLLVDEQMPRRATRKQLGL